MHAHDINRQAACMHMFDDWHTGDMSHVMFDDWHTGDMSHVMFDD
jgi:hypothetical protein